MEDQIVEAGCAQCQFGFPGNDCDLAVRFDGKVYFVRGTGIDDHGVAHADDGFCNTIRRARVSGHLESGIFMVSKLALLSD